MSQPFSENSAFTAVASQGPVEFSKTVTNDFDERNISNLLANSKQLVNMKYDHLKTIKKQQAQPGSKKAIDLGITTQSTNFLAKGCSTNPSVRLNKKE